MSADKTPRMAFWWLSTLSLSFPDKNCQGKNNIKFYRLSFIRVMISKTADFTNILQQMPTIQSPQDKATRPKVKFYNIHMVASGPNHLKFQYLCSRQAYITYHGHQSRNFVSVCPHISRDFVSVCQHMSRNFYSQNKFYFFMYQKYQTKLIFTPSLA